MLVLLMGVQPVTVLLCVKSMSILHVRRFCTEITGQIDYGINIVAMEAQ